jgi:hypothetical protein
MQPGFDTDREVSSEDSEYEAEDSTEYIYEAICESRLLYGAEILGIEEGWEEINRVQGSFCKEVLRIQKCAMNGLAEVELGRESIIAY